MSAFADSSALVKLYSDEPGSADVRSLSPLVASTLARVEVPAAFWRKHRIGDIDVAQTRSLAAELEADLIGTAAEGPRFLLVSVNRKILDHAARLLAHHPLRAYDSVQLASALAVSQTDDEFDGFACFDRALRDASKTEGLEPLPGA